MAPKVDARHEASITQSSTPYFGVWTPESNGIPFTWCWGGATFESTYDNTMQWGSNVAPGGRVVPGKARFADVLEQDYESAPGTHVFERYMEAWNEADDIRVRPVYVNFDHETGVCAVQLQASNGNAGGSGQISMNVGAVQVVKVLSGAVQLVANVALSFLASGAKTLLSAMNVAGTNVRTILQMYADDNVGLGGTGVIRFDPNAAKLAFHAVNPISKPTVTGSKGGNAALASLLTALANYGLITDSTT